MEAAVEDPDAGNSVWSVSSCAYETTNLGQLSKEQEAALLVLLKQAFYKYKQ